MVGFDQDHPINTLVGGISPLVSLQIASKMKQERQEHELQAPEAYLGIVSWTSRACAMALHLWLAHCPGSSKLGLRGRKQHQLVAYVQRIRQEFAADATQLSIGMQSAFFYVVS